MENISGLGKEGDDQMDLPPGFRFHPTDEELISHYLYNKVLDITFSSKAIGDVDLNKSEPWELPWKAKMGEKEWYFFCVRDRKYPTGLRTNRTTEAGYWKATGKDRPVNSQKRPVGMKKTLVYYRGRAPHGIRTNWVMHEYRLIDSLCGAAPSSLKDSYALCRVFKKTIHIPKKKEEENNGTEEKDAAWVSEEQLLGDDTSGIPSSKGREAEDENFNNDYCKFPSETSSSDVTQGTPIETAIADDLQAPFPSDEANSSASLYSMGVDFSSNLIQDMQMPNCSSLHYQFPFPPLELEDFPQISITESMKPSKPEIIDDYMMYKDCMNGTLEEIFSLCSSQDNSHTALPMQD